MHMPYVDERSDLTSKESQELEYRIAYQAGADDYQCSASQAVDDR
jgi:hypothetical protein